MRPAKDVIPWKVTDISIRPYEDMWSMNPSLHFDGQTWRCSLRCVDYAMPGGRTIRSKKAGPGHQTKNAMVILDPTSWKPIQIFKMHERDAHPRVPCPNTGYEDMRIFRTDKGGLQGIAASLHLQRDRRPNEEAGTHQPPEQVLLSFDEAYNIVGSRPIRGDWWSGTPQKNWVPFDDCAEPRFLYSIGKGTMFDANGALHGSAAEVRPSAASRPLVAATAVLAEQEKERQARAEMARQERARQEQEAREAQERQEREKREERERRKKSAQDPRTRLAVRSTDVSMVRGRRVAHDSMTSRPSYNLNRGGGAVRVSSDARTLSAGRTLIPRYEGLRGGTQLVRVGDDAWLGIGHEMRYEKSLKYYWHTWYVVDRRGKMTAASEPCKLAPEGIEFAAGMGIDGDRVVVSFGVDDMACKLGETQLSAVMRILEPVVH